MTYFIIKKSYLKIWNHQIFSIYLHYQREIKKEHDNKTTYKHHPKGELFQTM